MTLHAAALAQAPTVSNIRKKTLHVKPGSQQVDSLSIVPGSLHIEGVPDSLYHLDPINGTIEWISGPGRDSVQVVYRSFPYRLNAPSQRMRFDTVMGKFVVTPLTDCGAPDSSVVVRREQQARGRDIEAPRRRSHATTRPRPPPACPRRHIDAARGRTARADALFVVHARATPACRSACPLRVPTRHARRDDDGELG